MVSGSGARDLGAATLAVAEAGLPLALAASEPLRARIELRFARARRTCGAPAALLDSRETGEGRA